VNCGLCRPSDVLINEKLARVRHDGNSLGRGHVLVVSKRHVAEFFDMTPDEQAALLGHLN